MKRTLCPLQVVYWDVQLLKPPVVKVVVSKTAVLDKNYFEVIRADEVDVTVISKNTRHIWLIHNAGYPYESSCVLFHAHSPAMPYHQHGRANTLGQAVRSIKNHDKWQLKGRPGERRKDFILQVQ